MAVLDGNSNTENAKLGVQNYKNALIPRTTLASVASLSLPLTQEVVLLADFGCKGCQEKVAAIMSRMHGKTVSIEVSISEKKVTLTSLHPTRANNPTKQVGDMLKNSSNKSSWIKRLFRSFCIEGLDKRSPIS